MYTTYNYFRVYHGNWSRLLLTVKAENKSKTINRTPTLKSGSFDFSELLANRNYQFLMEYPVPWNLWYQKLLFLFWRCLSVIRVTPTAFQAATLVTELSTDQARTKKSSLWYVCKYFLSQEELKWHKLGVHEREELWLDLYFKIDLLVGTLCVHFLYCNMAKLIICCFLWLVWIFLELLHTRQ